MNRRGGSFGGGQRGFNRPSNYSNQFESRGGGGGGLNPWQGAGGGGNQGGGQLLSQITSNPQLALAITSLLQPQQQQPPSLLSLNTGNSYSSNRGFGGSGGLGSGGRFGGNSGSFNRNRDFRRPDSYNKSRGVGDRRQPFKKKPIEDKKKPVKKEDDTEDGGDEEKKRDWKDEKNSGEATESGNKDGKYGGVPRKYLRCFVCNKKMWDGESMGKHVRGRAHHEMLKAMEESIQICVSILRENLRLTEERRLIEYNRQNRWHKFEKRREAPMSHCNMCDLKFLGKIMRHRRTEGHQRLKTYLHPTCTACDKEYPSRMEWVEHCLTPEHLRKAHGDEVEDEAPAAEAPAAEEADAEEPAPEDAAKADAEGQVEEKKEVYDLALEPLLEENLHLESDEPILDLDEPQENMIGRLPAYKPNRQLAKSCLMEFNGWRCELCCRSFTNLEDGEAHLQTKKHFLRFTRHIKKLFDVEEKKKKAAKEAAEKQAEEAKKENGGEKEGDEEGDQEMYDPTEATEDDVKEEAVEEEEETADAETKMDTSPAKPKVESKPEPPATPRASARKAVGGPKSKRGGKK